jgi:hypothetical protein
VAATFVYKNTVHIMSKSLKVSICEKVAM